MSHILTNRQPLSTLILVLLSALFIVSIGGVLSGCRQKCVPGSENYPDCRGPAPVSDRTLVVWNLFDDKRLFEEQFAEFEKSHPGVTIDYQSFSDEEEYERLLINKIAEGKGPDIFAMHYSWIPEHLGKMASAPVQYDIASYREIFYSAIPTVLVRKEGETEKIYGVPLWLDTLGLYYNPTAFRSELQSDYSPAETWQEFQGQVANLSRKDKTTGALTKSGVAMGLGSNITYAPDILSLLFLQYDADVFNDEMTHSIIAESQDTAPSQSVSKPGVAALDLYAGFANEKNVHYSWNASFAADYGGKKELGAFLTGKTATIFGYSDLLAQLKKMQKEMGKEHDDFIDVSSVQVVPVPQLVAKDASQWGDIRNLARFYPFAVSKTSLFQENSWDLLFTLANKENAQIYADKSGFPSARRDIGAEQANLAGSLSVFAKQLAVAEPIIMGNKQDFEDIIRKTEDRAAAAGNSATVLATAQKRLECVIKRIKGEINQNDCQNLAN